MKRALQFILLSGFLLAVSDSAQSQAIGIGGQIGDPTGITLRIGSTGSAIDIAAGWNINTDSFFAQAHYIPSQIALGAAPAQLRLFYGPGVFVGTRSRPVGDKASFGVSFNAGLSFWTGPVEIFGQLTPRLQLVESTDFSLGGAAGLRYYF
jgi:hypothetical protein